MKNITLLFALILSLGSHSYSVGDTLPALTLDRYQGGLVDKSTFDSKIMLGRTSIIFYVDPDHKDMNEEFTSLLQKKHYDIKKVGFYAFINLDATWKPNFVIEAIIKNKQKKYHRSIYITDKKKHLVKNWKLADNTSCVVITDKNLKILYRHDGKMNKSEIEKAFFIIEKSIQR